MTAISGKEVALKVGTGSTAVAVAAGTTTNLSINGQTVDVTNRDSAGWRELLAGGGTANVSITAEVVVTNSTQVSDFMSKVAAQTIDPYTLVCGHGITLAGNYQASKFDLKADVKSEQTYSITLESSGLISITPTV